MKNVAASVHRRLLNRARQTGENFNLLLVRYGTERLLSRLVRAERADEFVLKGASLFYVWTGEIHRPTRDIDVLRFGATDPGSMADLLRACVHEAEVDDGIWFDLDSIEARPIRVAEPYPGTRVTLLAYLGSARIALQLDVGAGDAVDPPARTVAYPSLLGFPTPTVRAYRFETAIAEKCEAMVKLGATNTRLKDFYDVFVLARDREFDAATIAGAVRTTFTRRATPLPVDGPPAAWTSAFGEDEGRRALWDAFLERSRIEAPPLARVCLLIGTFMMPVVFEAAGHPMPERLWSKGAWRLQ